MGHDAIIPENESITYASWGDLSVGQTAPQRIPQECLSGSGTMCYFPNSKF